MNDAPGLSCVRGDRPATIEACLALIRGEKSPRVARQAFIAAATDAKIFLGGQI
ncbi:DUF982 domain-containing protein [Mesorhizobium sp. M0622]|uniref:DUF982 domain-containing protein n=1 Tax=unclassified Mesorhizobium TaxID=325217 RepID=UPI003339A2F0